MTIRVNDRWRHKGCAFWVSKRQYRNPGRCENRRGCRPIWLNGKFEVACAHHQGMVENGFALRLSRDVEAEQARVRRAAERERREAFA